MRLTGRTGYLLVLEAALVSDPGQVPASFESGPGGDSLFETCAWQEEVDDVAVEGVGGTAQGPELDPVGGLAGFEISDGGLAQAHALRELLTGHAERVADGAHPAAVGPMFLAERRQPSKTSVEMLPSSRAMGTHGMSLPVTAGDDERN